MIGLVAGALIWHTEDVVVQAETITPEITDIDERQIAACQVALVDQLETTTVALRAVKEMLHDRDPGSEIKAVIKQVDGKSPGAKVCFA